LISGIKKALRLLRVHIHLLNRINCSVHLVTATLHRQLWFSFKLDSWLLH